VERESRRDLRETMDVFLVVYVDDIVMAELLKDENVFVDPP
jgi:hypothetical protein